MRRGAWLQAVASALAASALVAGLSAVAGGSALADGDHPVGAADRTHRSAHAAAAERPVADITTDSKPASSDAAHLRSESNRVANADGQRQQKLRITSPGPDRVRVGVDGKNAVALSARRTRDGQARATVRLPDSGGTISVTRDLDAGRAVFSGNGTVISQDERRAVRELAQSLSNRWRTGDLSEHSDLAARVINMLSEAPDGVPLQQQTMVQPHERWSDSTPGPKALRARDCANRTGQPGASSSSEDDDQCQIDSGEGIRYFKTCASTDRVFGHDADDHCYEQRESFSGPGSPECFGRCGAGCPGVDHQYTYDCGDHDQCAGEHGENLGGCADEWRDAADDYLFARSNCTGSSQSQAAPARAVPSGEDDAQRPHGPLPGNGR